LLKSRLILCLAALMCSSAGLAQSAPVTPEAGKRIFTPDFFSSYGPVTALDLVNRVPGFSIDDGGDARGFGSNAGNVLIDGDRASTKSDNIRTLLSRIPVSQVERLELSEQAGSAADARGQTQTVNVIRKAQSSLSGTYEANIELGQRDDVRPFGNTSLTLRRGVTSYEMNAGYFSQRNRLDGLETTRSGAGVLSEQRPYQREGKNAEYTLGGAIKTRFGDTKLNVNGKYQYNKGSDERQSIIQTPAATELGREHFFGEFPQKRTTFELGGDIDYAWSPALTTKIIVLHTRKHEVSRSEVEDTGASVRNFFTAVRNDNRSDESILRLQNTLSSVANHNIQFGAEAALNRLNAGFSGSTTAAGRTSLFTPFDVRVREWRVEPFVSDVWSLSPAWKLEAGLVAEKSWLKVSGDAAAARSFLFLKPRLVASWTINKSTSLELRAERTADQLDFGEFASSVDLAVGGQVDAGNSELRPPRYWTLSSKLRYKFWERGSVQLLTSYVFIKDTLDLVPITVRDAGGTIVSRFDGAGNIGNGRQWNVELDVTLPLDRLTKPLGITGMELKYTGHYHASRVTDPVTGRTRLRSGDPIEHHHFVEFRHDVGQSGFAWGGEVFVAARHTQYFFNQIDSGSNNPDVFMFVEYKKFKLGTLRFQVGNPTDVEINRFRTFYVDTRASGVIDRVVERRQTRDMRFQLSLSGKF
jgi:TonB-dependent Receptor Plug Domain